MTSKEAVRRLKRLGACKDGLAFVARFKTFEAAWSKCKTDWMLWFVHREAVPPVLPRVAGTCDCTSCFRYRFSGGDEAVAADIFRTLVTPAEAAELLRRATK